MNRLLDSSPVSSSFLELFNQIPNSYHPQKLDFLKKSEAVYHAVAQIADTQRINSLLDVGCGKSHLAAFLKAQFDIDKVVGLDFYEWFPDNEKLGVQSVAGDFNVFDLDERFDVVIDVCATHLFDTESTTTCLNMGMKNAYQRIFDLLSDDGIFVTCTDVATTTESFGEFIHPTHIMDMAKHVGFYFEKYIEIGQPFVHRHPYSSHLGPTDGGPINVYLLVMKKSSTNDGVAE